MNNNNTPSDHKQQRKRLEAQFNALPVGDARRTTCAGDVLYYRIAQHEPVHAGKITGMLLEGVPEKELLCLVESEKQLKDKVSEAMQTLRKFKPEVYGDGKKKKKEKESSKNNKKITAGDDDHDDDGCDKEEEKKKNKKGADFSEKKEAEKKKSDRTKEDKKKKIDVAPAAACAGSENAG